MFSDAPSIPFEYTEEKASELLNIGFKVLVLARFMLERVGWVDE